jgi:hypothetical protein
MSAPMDCDRLWSLTCTRSAVFGRTCGVLFGMSSVMLLILFCP